MPGTGQFVNPVQVEVTSDIGADVAADNTAPPGATAVGMAILGYDSVNNRLRIPEMSPDGSLVVIAGSVSATGAFDTGSLNESIVVQLVRAAMTGRDSSVGAGSQNVPIEGRNFNANSDVAATLNGLVTNSRLAVFDDSMTDWVTWLAHNMTTGFDDAAVVPAVRAHLSGRDTSAGAGVEMIAIESRNADANADFAASLIGLTTNSRLAVSSPDDYGGANDYLILEGFIDNSTTIAGLVTADLRESGYLSSRAGRRFIATSQTAGAELTAQATFVATTPTLMLRQSSGATETEVVRSVQINSQAATPSVIKVVVMLDPDDRFSAGGTSVTPQNPNEGSSAASGITSFLENATATAADADERIVWNGSFVGGDGAMLTLNFKDELMLSGVGTLLVYVFDAAGAAAPTISYNVEWEEYV